LPQPPQFKMSFAGLTHRPPQQLMRQSHWASLAQPPPVPEEVLVVVLVVEVVVVEVVVVEVVVVEVVVTVAVVLVERPPCPPAPATWRSLRLPHAAAMSAATAESPAQVVARGVMCGLSPLANAGARGHHPGRVLIRSERTRIGSEPRR
jgi:hypothetical protein